MPSDLPVHVGVVLIEMVVNIVLESAPGAAIAFNTKAEDTADAAARQLRNG